MLTGLLFYASFTSEPLITYKFLLILSSQFHDTETSTFFFVVVGFRELVSGTSPNPEPLKANTTTELDFDMKVAFTMLLSLARDIGADWDIDYDLQINVVGNVPAMGDVTIPISNKGQMKLPTLKDLSALANLTTNLSVTV